MDDDASEELRRISDEMLVITAKVKTAGTDELIRIYRRARYLINRSELFASSAPR